MKKTAQGSSARQTRALSQEDEIQELRDRLEEAEETLDALRRGAVDAVVVRDKNDHHVYSLTGADQPYRVYVERMQEGAVTASADGVVLFCNLRFAEMAGVSLEKIIGSSIHNHVDGETWQRLSQVFASDGFVAKERGELAGADGGRMPVLYTASELPLAEHRVMCLVVTDARAQEENMHLRNAKEAAEGASRAKDHFFAALSHELRTPLTPVLMTLAAWEADPAFSPELREDVRMMKRNIELETKLIDDLLDLNRITSGKLKLEAETVDINEIVRHVCEICRSELHERGIQLEAELEAGIGLVSADPARLQQVLWNVIKNAIKFTAAQGLIRVTTRQADGAHAEVRVEDNGVGIPPEMLPRIFNAFEQGGASVTRRFGGLGLGLAISKAIMELHHGYIRVESAGAGKGAASIIGLPGKMLTATAKIRLTTPAKKQPVPGLRLLVVEDHADTLRTLNRLLNAAGFTVFTASSVAQAVELASHQAIDMVVSDLGLPDGDGREVMRRIRSTGETPGIAMSGYGTDEDVQRSLDAGFSEHLTKPVEFATLKQAILRLAAGQHA